MIRLVVCFVLASAAGDAVRAEGAGDKHERLRFLVAGMQNEREKLKSGVYTASGTLKRTDQQGSKVEGDCKFFCGFDNVARKVRFDSSEPRKVGMIINDGKGQPDTLAGPPKQMPVEKKMARVPGQTASWQTPVLPEAPKTASGQPLVSQMPIFLDREDAQTAEEPIDVRAVGLLLWGDLHKYSLLQILPAYTSEEQGIDEIVEETDRPDVTRIVATFGKKRDGLRKLWIDTRNGFTPIRLEVYRQTSQGWAKQPAHWSEVKWANKSGVWVPMEWTLVAETPQYFDRYDLKFTWELVNEPPPERLFSYEDFGAPNGTRVVDQRLGPQTTVKVLGESPPPLPSRTTGSGRPLVVFLASAAILVIAVGVLLWSRRHALRRGGKS